MAGLKATTGPQQRLVLLTQRAAQTAKQAGVPRDQFERLLRMGVVLQERQFVASALARQCDLPDGPTEIGYGGARGGGKSHWMLAQMVEDCLRYAGLKCLLLRKVGRAVREAFEDLRRKILRNVPHRYNRQEGMLYFPNGSQIKIGHFKDEKDVDNYLGLEYDVVGVEEATTLSWTKYEAILTCNRSSKPGWQPRMYSTTNPGGIGHTWYKKRFITPYRNGTEQWTRFVPATVDDNAFVNQSYTRILKNLTGWRLRAWRYGDWDIAAGQFFSNFRADLHVVKPLKVPDHWRVWLALDWGFQHLAVVYLLAQDGDGITYVVDEHAERRWLPETHAAAVTQMLTRHGLRREELYTFVAGHDVFAQRGGEGGTIAEQWEQHGYTLEPANVDRISGAAEFLRLLGDAERDIAPHLFISERCTRLIECLPAMIHDERRPEDVLKIDVDDDGNGGDDPYDAARYGIMVPAAWGVRQAQVGANPLAGYRG